MTDTLAAPAGLDHPFVTTLVRTLRAEDPHGIWERLSDAQLLKDFVVTKEQRRAIPILGDPDKAVIFRLEKFYAAVGLAIEAATGHMASPIMKLHSEGFGRVLLTTGRLVVVQKSLRDVHRFGFEDFSALAAAGQKLVDEAVALLAAHPDVADL